MGAMETKPLTPYFVVIGLMLLTSFLLAFSVDVKVTDEAGIAMALPDRVGDWRGEEFLHCLNQDCEKEFKVNDLPPGTKVCPSCGGPLDPMTLAEKTILPADTVLLRKKYTSPTREVVFVSIVLSGKERSSIHRPQMCLVGQGNEIVDSTVVPIPIDGRKPLDVMVLELLRREKLPNGRQFEMASYYAYWFVGKGRETPYHLQRMVWMATDRIFRNVSHRWAYISVSGGRRPGTTAYREQMTSFLHDLYPQILLKNP